MKKFKFDPVSSSVNFPEMEKKILSDWYEKGIVDKYLHRNDNARKRFSFLDGPITANNPMGVHHAWGRSYKDLWQRFHNMQGFRERFQNGFDCQGLWVEVEVEKELGIKNKRDIENLIPGDKRASIAKFVELCKERVRKFSAIQTEQSKRLGYFMDWNNSYYTMSDENNYMIWHFLKRCHEKGWIYKGEDSVPWCPRCQTAISQHEMLTEDYKELTHDTVFVKLPITTKDWENISLLVWTTTPWTVPANVAVGVNTKYTYGVWKNSKTNEQVIILNTDENGNVPVRLTGGKELPIHEYVFAGTDGEWKHEKEVYGNQLIGLKYKAPFDHLPRVQAAKKENSKTFHTVVDGSEIVVATEGTGLLHVAPGAGKEDFDLGKKEHLPVISVIDDEAYYLEGMDEFSTKNAKKHPEIILDYLSKKEGGIYFLKKMKFTHRYPACWRCKTELVWKVAQEWYIAMDVEEKQDGRSQMSEARTLREQMKKTAMMIEWHPEFGLERELDWLSNMHDWLISKKNRYWGLALPLYECKKCGWFDVIGGKDELQEKAISGWKEFEGHTPHKPFIDEVKIRCEKCGEVVNRVDDVGNVWLDAGIVPFSTFVDPETKELSYTTDKTYWKEWFPIDFITESFPGQFKNWFYSMIAMSTVLEKRNPFKTVLGYASVLGEDGRPMHKSWGNAIEFNEGADKIGADVMRWTFMRHNPEVNILFGFKTTDDVRRHFHLLLWNVYNFFVTYATLDNWQPGSSLEQKHVLDRWILSKLTALAALVTSSLSNFDAATASSAIETFVTDLSQWYVRRSRDRVGPTATDEADKNACHTTLYTVLVTLCKLLAPFTPYLSDEIYRNLTGEESVHLSDWPSDSVDVPADNTLEHDMEIARKVVAAAHALRKQHQIKVRIPLARLTYKASKKLDSEVEKVILEETNIKVALYQKLASDDADPEVALDTEITPDLKKEGDARELVRQIQMLRKEKGCKLDERVAVQLPKEYKNVPEPLLSYIKTETLADTISWGDTLQLLTG